MFKHIHIIGSGAIGSFLAATAQLQKHSVVRHIRSEPVESVHMLNGETVHLNTLQNCWPTTPAGESLVILPLKSYQISAAISEYVDYFPSNSAVVLLHNGMGCYQQVANLLAAHHVFLATTSMGAYKPSAVDCIHTGVGKTIVGAAGENHNEISQQSVVDYLQSLISPVIWHTNVEHALWQKLAVNALINPLTAINNIPNGELLKPQFSAQIASLASELVRVTNAENLNFSETEVLAMTFDVIQKTANNYSSMQQDVQRNQNTEIDAINGFVLNCARKHGIDCPNHQTVYQQVKALTKPLASYAGTK